MPLEQDIPAPVTTTIFFPLTTDDEIADSMRLVLESVDISSILRVTVFFFSSMIVYNKDSKLKFNHLCYQLFGSSRVERSRVSKIKIELYWLKLDISPSALIELI